MIMQVKTAKLAAALDIGGFGVVFAATTFAISEFELRIMVIGMICACLNVLMYGSPLAAMVSFSVITHPYLYTIN
jgi:solute carrier family 50 (sugar transporter)